MDQVDDPELLGTHCCATGSRSGHPTGFEGFLTVDALGEIETEEKVPPRRVNRIGVGEELPIEGLDGGRLGVAQMGMEVH